jgi:hypothetical protein
MSLKDLAIFQPASSFYEAALANKTSSGRILTGQEKLAQRFMLELMTEQGSMPFMTDRGSPFLSLLRNGAVFSENDVSTAFYAALLVVRANLQSEETDSDEDIERFIGATLNSIQITSAGLALNISVVNAAQQAIGLAIPVKLQR